MTSSPGGLQDESGSSSTRSAPPSLPALRIPKGRAGQQKGYLSPSPSEVPQLRRESDGGAIIEEDEEDEAPAEPYDTLTRSPLLSPTLDTGLYRIRRQAPASLRAISPLRQRSLDAASANPTPNPSRTSSINHASAPLSPALPHGEDLSRFPTESLHSFSFAHQGADSIRSRQNVLKRSIEFMRDKLGWANSTPRIASAQAKLAGDEELLSMMELLQKASALSPEGLAATTAGLGVGIAGPGPLTGPAHLAAAGVNPFEQSFENNTLSRQTTLSTSAIIEEDEPESKSEGTLTRVPSTGPNLAHVNSKLEPFSEERRNSKAQEATTQRASLKRTYTDTTGLSLQHSLGEAMSQPYHTSSIPPLHTINAPTFRPPAPNRSTTLNERHPHGHRNNQAQAIFTTAASDPWTITAANDLACLVFGVTRAEVRKLGIMEVIDASRRKWLEDKLRNPDSGTKTPTSTSGSRVTSAPSASTTTLVGALGNGITARLLSKPPSKKTYSPRRSKTEGTKASPANPHHSHTKSRGVLLCGDVVPIRKMNGATGSASLWVKEKGGGLIWVLEEIAEDVAFLTIDEIGSVLRGHGDVQAIWGLERVRNGMDIQRLIPGFPKLKDTNTGAVDYDALAMQKGYTARTSNAISIPITIELMEGSEFRVSSFPHIAGIIVVNPTTMKVNSSNAVFSSALFGYAKPDGLAIETILPGFGEVLKIMTLEDGVRLEDGIVIPEYSFRRARAVLTMREGKDADRDFLRPSGLPARHRDGAEIMVDVQMRVIVSDSRGEVILEEEEAESELVYALWVTYSRQVHAVSQGVGTVTPRISRPGTPPQQPIPGDDGTDEISSPNPTASDSEDPKTDTDAEPYEHPSPDMLAAGARTIKKKRIADFSILEDMGAGAYGEVKLARYKKPAAKKMVVKYVTKRRILVDTWHRDRRLGTVPLEIHVLDYLRRDGLQHPNIVCMADFFEDDINYYIEMVPHGLPGMDLFDYIELRVTMEEGECRKIFRQVALALQHLHCKASVVHRDIKDENVVLDGEGRVKLVDFGSAAYIKSGPFDVFVGTIDYAAPEVLRGHPYRGKEQDVWALGILLYTIVYKENPFYSIDEIMDHDLRVPYVMSEDCIDLIRRMLDRDVERRIEIQGVLEHAWCVAGDE